MKHFLLDCTSLENERDQIEILQRPRIENLNNLIGDLIFKEYNKYEKEIYDIWLKRKSLIKTIQDQI